MEKLPSNYQETLLLLKERIKLAQYKSLSIVNTEMIQIGHSLWPKSLGDKQIF
jgi:hypothetical protein